jgi:hypothetical protein
MEPGSELEEATGGNGSGGGVGPGASHGRRWCSCSGDLAQVDARAQVDGRYTDAEAVDTGPAG